MIRILITYDTVSNSTKQAATLIKNELTTLDNASVDLIRYCDVTQPDSYDIVIIGSPMRFKNFNPAIRTFISKNKKVLQQKKVFFFLTCLYLIEATEKKPAGFPVFIDPSFDAAPKSMREMNMMDKTHSNIQYIDTVLSHSIPPKAIGYFKGKLDLHSLGLLSRLFMRVVLLLTKKEQIGDFLNPESVSKWASELKEIIRNE